MGISKSKKLSNSLKHPWTPLGTFADIMILDRKYEASILYEFNEEIDSMQNEHELFLCNHFDGEYNNFSSARDFVVHKGIICSHRLDISREMKENILI